MEAFGKLTLKCTVVHLRVKGMQRTGSRYRESWPDNGRSPCPAYLSSTSNYTYVYTNSAAIQSLSDSVTEEFLQDPETRVFSHGKLVY